MKAGTILFAEDDLDDVFFFERAVRKAGGSHRVIRVSDGQELIDYLTRSLEYGDPDTFPLPSVVVLDLRMPKKSGLEVLDWIRSQPELEFLNVAILTGSTNPGDEKAAFEKGADFFASKVEGQKAYWDTLSFIQEILALDWAMAGTEKIAARRKHRSGNQMPAPPSAAR